MTTTSTGAINGSRVYYHAYGTTRAGNTATLNTDRTFTGQKQDGTGLLYYNAYLGLPQATATLILTIPPRTTSSAGWCYCDLGQ